MTQTSCVTGISGQTGSYLAEILLDKGHKVYGMIRKSSNFTTERIAHLYDNPNLKLVYGDLNDAMSVVDFVTSSKPDYFFNLGGFSHVRSSFELPLTAMDVDGLGVMRCLEAIRKYSPGTKFLQAATSELFGDAKPPQNELTPFKPRSPYAIGKLAGFASVVNYREAYEIHASNAISFNHESPRRNPTFVTRKITKSLCSLKMGLTNKLYLGNLTAKRDFTHAKDVAEAMYLIIKSDIPDDYVIGTGVSYSVEDFLNIVANKLGLNWHDYVKFDPRLLRPTEVPFLQSDSAKIRKKLGWEPKITFDQLIDEMIESDLKLAQQEKLIKENLEYTVKW